jgi:hypothetical protein
MHLLALANNLPIAAQMNEVVWIPSLVMSAAAAEAFANDMHTLVKSFPEKSAKLTTMVEMLSRIEDSKGQTMLKYEAIMFVLTGLPMDRGQEPFQSLDLLMDLRNRIVHGRTVVLKADAETGELRRSESDSKFIRKLEAKQLILGNDKADWMDLISNREAGLWGIMTVHQCMKCVFDHFETEHPTFHQVWKKMNAPLSTFAEKNK